MLRKTEAFQEDSNFTLYFSPEKFLE